MTREQFQQAHGAIWSKIVAEPCFFDALRLAGAERLREIENLTAAEIEVHGRVHLASFQGHLKTESILLGLAVEVQGEGFDLPAADYGAPTEPERPPVTPPDSEPVRKSTKPRKRTK